MTFRVLIPYLLITAGIGLCFALTRRDFDPDSKAQTVLALVGFLLVLAGCVAGLVHP